MKPDPVGIPDVLRLARGEVTEEDEILRIMAAIEDDENLQFVFNIACEDELGDLDEPVPEPPAWLKTRLEQLRREQLLPCRRNPLRDLKPGEETTVELATGPMTTTLLTVKRLVADYPAYEFHVDDLPPGELLNVTLARFEFHEAPESCHVLSDVRRTEIMNRRRDRNPRGLGLESGLAAESRLAAAGAAGLSTFPGAISINDVAPDLTNLRMIESKLPAGEKLRKIEPVTVELFGQDRKQLQSHAYLLSKHDAGEEFDLFADIEESVAAVKARCLKREDLPLLSSDQLLHLLENREFTVGATNRISSAAYRFRIPSGNSAFLHDPSVTFCLTLSRQEVRNG